MSDDTTQDLATVRELVPAHEFSLPSPPAASIDRRALYVSVYRTNLPYGFTVVMHDGERVFLVCGYNKLTRRLEGQDGVWSNRLERAVLSGLRSHFDANPAT